MGDYNQQQPMMNQQMGQQPMMNQQMNQQPMMNQQMNQQPMMNQQNMGQQPMMYQENMGQQPMMNQQNMGQQPMMNQQMNQQPMMNQQMQQPMMNQQMAGQPPMMGQQQVIVQPPVYVQFHGAQMTTCPSVMQNLQDCPYATIIQEMELLEIVSGCETENRYNVFVTDSQGCERYLFKCKENSSWCQRNCCTSQSRGFTMKLKHVVSNSVLNDDFGITFAEFKRPFKLTCCCLGRPEMIGVYTQKGNTFGKVVEQCTICDPMVYVYNKDGDVRYKITGTCCQCGFMCRKNTFGKLSEARFNILNGDSNENVGTITRKVIGFQNLISDADTFSVTFPTDARAEDKLLIIGSVLMMDYQYYENDAKDDKKKREQKKDFLLYPHHHH